MQFKQVNKQAILIKKKLYLTNTTLDHLLSSLENVYYLITGKTQSLSFAKFDLFDSIKNKSINEILEDIDLQFKIFIAQKKHTCKFTKGIYYLPCDCNKEELIAILQQWKLCEPIKDYCKSLINELKNCIGNVNEY